MSKRNYDFIIIIGWKRGDDDERMIVAIGSGEATTMKLNNVYMCKISNQRQSIQFS